MGWAGLFGLALGMAGEHLAAQQSPPPSAEIARVRIDVLAAATSIDGSAVLTVGGGALVGLGSRLWLGGAGSISGRVDHTDPSGNRSSVGIGFGGLVVELEAVVWPSGSLSTSVLVGGGNADVTDSVVGAELGSDNFLVLQPIIRFRRTLRRSIAIGVDGGYRLAMGVQDLPGLDRGDLSSPTLGISIHATRE